MLTRLVSPPNQVVSNCTQTKIGTCFVCERLNDKSSESQLGKTVLNQQHPAMTTRLIVSVAVRDLIVMSQRSCQRALGRLITRLNKERTTHLFDLWLSHGSACPTGVLGKDGNFMYTQRRLRQVFPQIMSLT